MPKNIRHRAGNNFLIQPDLGLSHADKDVLHLGVVLKDHLMGFTSDTGVLVAAERCVGRQIIVVVDPHPASFNPSGDPQGTIDILGPDRAAKAELVA